MEVSARAVPAPAPRDLAQALERGSVTVSVDPYTLPLADVNVLETIVAALGGLAVSKFPLRCRNCGAEVEVDAVAALPLAPLLLPPGDPELDPPVDQVRWYSFDAAIEVGRKGACERFRLGRRTLKDRVRLAQILGDDHDAPLPLGAPLIRALGLEALGKGDEVVVTSPIAISRALEALDDEAFASAWDAIMHAFEEQHWPPRLLSPVGCPACGARHDVEVLQRPLAFAPARAERSPEAFPALEAFTARTDTITREILGGSVDFPGLVVVVEDGVPPCDDGGEPLLGSYTPDESPGEGRVQGAPFVIALYYRTFRSMWEDEPYDLDAEIRETVEHELEHHQGLLDGDDPLDDEERAAIVTEHNRLHGVRPGQELTASAGWLATDFGQFLRRTWPLWVLVAIVTLLLVAGDR